MFKHRALVILILLVVSKFSFGQFDNMELGCKKYFTSEYVSDGQEYYATLKPDQKIEFRTTFFGNSTYRIVACSNISSANLVFSVFDTDKNLLFCSEDYNSPPYWNFNFTSTVTCIIQIDVKSSKFKPGYVLLLIGFKP